MIHKPNIYAKSENVTFMNHYIINGELVRERKRPACKIKVCFHHQRRTKSDSRVGYKRGSCAAHTHAANAAHCSVSSRPTCRVTSNCHCFSFFLFFFLSVTLFFIPKEEGKQNSGCLFASSGRRRDARQPRTKPMRNVHCRSQYKMFFNERSSATRDGKSIISLTRVLGVNLFQMTRANAWSKRRKR